jgi:hypothetical protein
MRDRDILASDIFDVPEDSTLDVVVVIGLLPVEGEPHNRPFGVNCSLLELLLEFSLILAQKASPQSMSGSAHDASRPYSVGDRDREHAFL